MFWTMIVGLPGMYFVMYWPMSRGHVSFTSPAGYPVTILIGLPWKKERLSMNGDGTKEKQNHY
jgi:hypothetical protein